MSGQHFSKLFYCLLSGLLLATPATAFADGGAQDTQRRVLPTADSKEEYKSYSDIAAQQTPQAILEKSVDFLAKFEKSDLRSLVYQGMVASALRLGEHALAFETAQKALAEYPDHILVMTQLASYSANRMVTGDKTYAAEAEKYAREVLKLVEEGKMPYGYKVDRWKSYRTTVISDMQQVLGIVALQNGQHQMAAESLALAAQYNPYEPYTYYLLGKAQVAIYQKTTGLAKGAPPSPQAREMLGKIAETYARALLLTESDSYKSLRMAIDYDMQVFSTSLDQKIKSELASSIELARTNSTLLAKPPAAATTPNP